MAKLAWRSTALPAVATAGACAAAAILAVRILPRRGGLSNLGAVSQLDSVTAPTWSWWIVLVAAAFGFAAITRTPAGHQKPIARVAWMAVAFGLFGTMVSAHGHHALIVVLAALFAMLAPLMFRGTASEVAKAQALPWDRILPIACFAITFLLMAAFSLHRHANYGTGTWDHGNAIHNFYRASRFLPTVSTPLGDVDFLGDHFIVGIYLYVPLFWLHTGSATVLLIQSVNLACAAPALYLIARHHGAPRNFSCALALAGGLSFGLQSGAYFDSHEITLGFGFLCWGLWAFETKRLGVATACLIAFSWFKESLGAYVLALGLLAILRGMWARDKKQALYGASWVVYGAVWFVLVNRVFMPAFQQNGVILDSHETFADFGPTVFKAAVGMATNPIKAAFAIFVPHAKMQSLLTTLLGTGGLVVLSPQVFVAALPLVAERFLSSKATMWEMGYHYAAPLCLYAAWGTALAYPRITKWTAGWLPGGRASVAWALTLYIAAAALLENGYGYKHPANFMHPPPSYFSTPAKKAANDKAVALIRKQGRDAKVSAQNRLLPHMADRAWIWRHDLWRKADWVVVSQGESAWPWDNNYPRRLTRQLLASGEWKLVFAEADTGVLVRKSVSDLPEVPPTPGLK